MEPKRRGHRPESAHPAPAMPLGWLGRLAIGAGAAAAAYACGRAQGTRSARGVADERTADLGRTAEALHLYQRAIESSANPVTLIDARVPGARIIHVNPAFTRMHGYEADEVLGMPLEYLAHDVDDQPGLHELRNAIAEGRETHASLHLRRKDGTPYHEEAYLAPVNDANGATEFFVILEYDVTVAKQYEAALEHRARHDMLTGLPNRVALADRIDRALAFARADAAPVWVAVLDLDQFKHVNDSLGAAAGDRLLCQAGERMLAAVGPTDTVARTGDDEFVLLFENRAVESQAEAAVRKVLAAIAEPFCEGGQRVFLTCSAGIASYPADGGDADSLVKYAQIAMYRAKESGRNTLSFYLPSMNERALERMALLDAMRNAMSAGQFELHYQPQVDLASGAVIGMEALIRWRHPRMGALGPDRFIALAEETGLIVPLGTWVLRAACAQAAAWQRNGLGALRIAVNLSSRQFKDAGLPQLIADILHETGLPAASLEIELTESLMMEDADTAVATMRALKRMGVHLSIDDFGTGYSSLSYLKRFPVDVLKIDQSFVRDIGHDANSAAMVAAMISLSHELGLRVIAEGVETRAQWDYLLGRGCDEIQGYYFSRPLCGSEFERLVRERGNVQRIA
ncbi:EAL domain-containing protein [Telluria mixta]|uniref:EAL domain-containing protein n=1 Tax=Telluria mixta TaxID=34071 RepID=A0ABT2BZE1_9BURK|nr:EAL domain-containing protein [Telluria mixta]MCS0630500.1 EAL domain-containing protein [Telluria mixta]WEM94196.1 EAL domain-containing protein [Telluria mixta]